MGAFGANQFKPNQQRYVENFFSIFYVSINLGSLISTILTPIFRSEKCFGPNDCFPLGFLLIVLFLIAFSKNFKKQKFPLAFGVPAAFMFIAIIFFVIGTPFYDRSKDRVKNKSVWENIILRTVGCIFTGISRKIRMRKSEPPREHWLDYSLEKYGAQTVSDVKAFCRVGFVFLPLPVFWALYDQQGSKWTDQAQQLNGKVGSATILPDQFQAANAILIVIL